MKTDLREEINNRLIKAIEAGVLDRAFRLQFKRDDSSATKK